MMFKENNNSSHTDKHQNNNQDAKQSPSKDSNLQEQNPLKAHDESKKINVSLSQSISKLSEAETTFQVLQTSPKNNLQRDEAQIKQITLSTPKKQEPKELIEPVIKKDQNMQSPLKKKSSGVKPLTPQDFEIRKRLGRGAYGDVFLAQKKSDKKLYAMKQILKRKLQKEKKDYQALVEKQILSYLKHPGIVKMRYAFQDKKILYFVLELCEGGQFLEFIKLNLRIQPQQAQDDDHCMLSTLNLNENLKKFYIAEIVNILEYLHKNGITHRDLKPQNLMMSASGHLKIIDFGTADISSSTILKQSFKERIASMKKKSSEQLRKLQEQNNMSDQQQLQMPQSPTKRRSTFVGTCYYISPQLLQQNYCPPAADLWALGCILYQMYYFDTPFNDNYQFAIFQKIKKCELQFPKMNKNNEIVNIPAQAQDLIQKLLKKNPDLRLGSGTKPELSYQTLKNHPFFNGLGIDIDKIFESNVPKQSSQISKKQPKFENQNCIKLSN